MKYEAVKAFHPQVRRPFMVTPDKPTPKQEKALKAILRRHPELEAKP